MVDLSTELPEALTRVGFSLAAGFVLGFEREMHGRAAGLRTTMLASFASCLAMLMADTLFRGSSSHAEITRVSQGILTGIGFIGSGVIIRQGDETRGVTTAATLWLATILGMIFGSGLPTLGLIGMGGGIVVLQGLASLEKYIRKDFFATVTVKAEMDGAPDAEIRHCIHSTGVKIKSVKVVHDLEERRRTLIFAVKSQNKEKDTHFALSQKVVGAISGLKGILEVRWE